MVADLVAEPQCLLAQVDGAGVVAEVGEAEAE
jgi:hypothetical protein